VHESILAEELERGLCPPNEQDLLAEQDEAHARVVWTADDQATKAEWLSWHVMHVAAS
jgi:hypothetical protein